jgi:thiaminase/transcriptional activator TenA
MTISKQLWQNNQDIIKNCLMHPFIKGIAQGNLDRQKFMFYIGARYSAVRRRSLLALRQDAFFLEAFARAYSIAAAKSNDWEGFNIFHRLADGVLTELNLHQSYALKWGVNLKGIQPVPATRCYTDFLLATAWGQDVGTTTIAMIPCMRLYAFLGQQLAQDGIPEHQYADWIYTYSSQEFEQLAQQLESLGDNYSKNQKAVESTYRYALLWEQNFFDAAWNCQF